MSMVGKILTETMILALDFFSTTLAQRLPLRSEPRGIDSRFKCFQTLVTEHKSKDKV